MAETPGGDLGDLGAAGGLKVPSVVTEEGFNQRPVHEWLAIGVGR